MTLGGNQDFAHVDGSWVSLGHMNLNPDGIGDGDQSDYNNSVYLVLGGQDVHFDNRVVIPEPTSLGLLLVGAAGLFNFRRRR